MNKKLVKFLTILVVVICIMAGLVTPVAAYGDLRDLCEDYSSCCVECCERLAPQPNERKPGFIEQPPNSDLITE